MWESIQDFWWQKGFSTGGRQKTEILRVNSEGKASKKFEKNLNNTERNQKENPN